MSNVIPLPVEDQRLKQIRMLAGELGHFEKKALRSRIALNEAMAKAHRSGVAMRDIVKAAGISRQRVYKIIDEQT